MTSIYDPSLYNIRHKQNRIYVQAEKINTIYKNNPRVPISREPRVKVYFIVQHKIVSDDQLPRMSHNDSIIFTESFQRFNQPLRAFAGDVGPTVEAMFSRLDLPFELGRPDYGRLLWVVDETPESQRGFDRIGGSADVVTRVRGFVERIFREATAEAAPVKVVEIGVRIIKLTIVPSNLYMSLYDDDDDDEDFEVNDEVNDDGFVAEEFLETVVVDGDDQSDDLVCSICMEEVSCGTHLSRLPCSHRFHGDCVVPWLQRKKSCPLCRFSLLNIHN